MSFNMQEGAHFYMDDVNIPNSWYSVESGMNSKLYIRVLFALDAAGFKDYIVDMPSEIYNGDTFPPIVKTLLNTAVGGDFFHVVYDANRNRIEISSTYTVYFKIFTDEDLLKPTSNWNSNNAYASVPLVPITDLNHLGSINQVIKIMAVHKNTLKIIPIIQAF